MGGMFVVVVLSLVAVAVAMGAVGSAGGGWRKRAGFTGCPPGCRDLLAEQGHPVDQAGGRELETALPGGVLPGLEGSGASSDHQRKAGLDLVLIDRKALRRVQQAWKATYAPRRTPARYA